MKRPKMPTRSGAPMSAIQKLLVKASRKKPKYAPSM